MKLEGFDFGFVEWNLVERVEHPGEKGTSHWRTVEVAGMRLRQVEYSPGFVTDHWCERGHVVLVLEGEVLMELQDGRSFVLRPGMSFHVADGREPHRSSSATGAKLFIVD